MPPESQIKNFRGAFHFGTPSSFIQYLPVLLLPAGVFPVPQ